MALDKDIEQRLIAELSMMAGIYLEHGWRDKAAETMNLVRKIEQGNKSASDREWNSQETPADIMNSNRNRRYLS